MASIASLAPLLRILPMLLSALSRALNILSKLSWSATSKSSRSSIVSETTGLVGFLVSAFLAAAFASALAFSLALALAFLSNSFFFDLLWLSKSAFSASRKVLNPSSFLERLLPLSLRASNDKFLSSSTIFTKYPICSPSASYTGVSTSDM